MSEITLTKQQAAAVSLRRSSLLVSAAAGSGKTRVLTERLMSYVCDESSPVSIDRFLIITYTRAAAAELKGRIITELSKRSAKEPENRRLRRQLTLCHRAQIGTIHSFCTNLLRENCHRLGISPDFRVGDEDKCDQLRQKALEKVLENAYEHMDENSGFSDLVDSVGAGRDDSRLENAILDLHGKMQSHPSPEKWAENQAENLEPLGMKDISETVWGKRLMEDAKKTASYWLRRLEDAWLFINSAPEENAPLINAYGDSLLQTKSQLRHFAGELNLGWDAAAKALPIEFPRLSPLRDYDYEDRKQLVVAAREGCKKAMTKICADFSDPSEKLFSELFATAPSMKALLSLTLEFDRVYTREKRRLNILDFSDLEHLALRLLQDENTGEPTELGMEISRRYREIMIDEYQDVNSVQEAIFRCVSQNEQNIFMVGDVKQSVYRFRLADPTIFLDKYHNFKNMDSAAETEPKKVLLQKNFRSDRGVLAACNHVFSNIMSEEVGEIAYYEDVYLFPRDDAPQGGKTLISVLTIPPAPEGGRTPDKTYLEAKMVAAQIKSLVDSGKVIPEGKTLRPVGYGDIAILLRSPGGAGAAFRLALSELGIPVSAEQGGGFFDSLEISFMVSLLSLIDNPRQDIALAAVLTSPVFAFSPDELAEIRSLSPKTDFYTAIKKCSLEDEKCEGFISLLDELRDISSDLNLVDFLSLIYQRLELFALFAAQDGADLALCRLSQLSDLAAHFEEDGYRGLHGFLAFLDRLQEKGEEPRASLSDSMSAVSIMSIHKSKGLEFPMVFLANTSRKFNLTDLRSPVLIHPHLGLGAKLTDLRRGIEYPTIARRAVSSALSAEMLSEEMRVLYVAMTRAKHSLYISCTDKDPDALFEKLSEGLSSPIDPQILKGASSMAHWLISAALLDSGGKIELRAVSPEDTDKGFEKKEASPETETHFDGINSLEELSLKLDYRYPHEESVSLPSKLTATMLPSKEQDGEALPLIRPRNQLFRKANFKAETSPLSGAEKGEASHIVMQFIDFSKTGSLSEIEAEIGRIGALGHINERQAAAVDRQSILRFFQSETGGLILSAEKVLREFRFSLLCPTKLFFENGGSEQVLLQGVIDCCLEEKDGLTIIDYKTDYVTEESLPELTEGYRKQILAYAYAMERIKNKPVKRRLLCFLRTGQVVEL